MRIRNDHPVARLVPAHHALVAPGQEIEWPDHLPAPDGFTVTEAPPSSRTKAQLLEQAAELGLELHSKATKPEIQAAIDAAVEPDETHDQQEQ